MVERRSSANKKLSGKAKIKVVLMVGLLFVICYPAWSQVVPKPTDGFYVNDFAGMLSAETKEQIKSVAETFYAKNNIQVVVVTIPSLDGADINQYAINLAREWKIGSAEQNTGVLILVAESESEIRIEVGLGLEAEFNDAKAGRLIRRCSAHIKKDYNGGIKELVALLIAELDDPGSVLRNDDEGSGTAMYVLAFLGFVALSFLAKKKGLNLGWLLWCCVDGHTSDDRNDRINRGGGGHFGGGGATGKF
ncbi:MAG: TPM domain-containing protein [Oscillospiraceae bacterium]|nr:TPM domain-containing protein [Oscillospiraceae bacterium]